MSSLNLVQLIGNLGRDPEIRSTNSGTRIANFSIACSETWRDKSSGEKKEKTEWVNCVVFSEGLVKVIEQYVKKGSKIYVSGRLQTRKWQNRDGQDRYSTEVVLQGFDSKLILLGESGGGRGNRASPVDSEDEYDQRPYSERHSNPSGGASRPDPIDDEIPY